MDEKGNALLIDFGLARIKHEVTRTISSIKTGGIYRYMAPELYSAILNDTDFRTSYASDSYSLGMTIVELLTLEHPYPQYGTPEAAAQQALQGVRPRQPDTIANFPLDILGALWRFLENMWAHDAENRPSLDGTEAKLTELLTLLPASQQEQVL